jgi:hypothetical protein
MWSLSNAFTSANSLGFRAHQSSAARVSGDGLIREQDLPEGTWSTVEWSVAFHCYYAVTYDEVDRHCGANVENALLNALRVENVLWPSVSCTSVAHQN